MIYLERKEALLYMIDHYSNLWQEYARYPMLKLDDLEMLNNYDQDMVDKYTGELAFLEMQRWLQLI